MSNYLGKTILSASYSFHKLEEDGITECVAVLNMLMKDGTRETEIVKKISEKEYFLYKLGAKTFDPFEKFRNKEDGS